MRKKKSMSMLLGKGRKSKADKKMMMKKGKKKTTMKGSKKAYSARGTM